MAAEATGIAGLILAGGKSTRMGGQDKASLSLNGKPMIEWVIERFRPQVDSLLLNSNDSGAKIASLAYPVVADTISGYPGPLAGLHAGMARTQAPLLACVPCDAPLLPRDLVARLHQNLQADQADIAVARTAGGLQPTFLLCRRTLGPRIEEFLGEGGRAFRQWLAQQHCIEVYFPDEAAFSNVNTPQDMDLIAPKLGK